MTEEPWYVTAAYNLLASKLMKDYKAERDKGKVDPVAFFNRWYAETVSQAQEELSDKLFDKFMLKIGKHGDI